jgi:hypothetical protein
MNESRINLHILSYILMVLSSNKVWKSQLFLPHTGIAKATLEDNLMIIVALIEHTMVKGCKQVQK